MIKPGASSAKEEKDNDAFFKKVNNYYNEYKGHLDIVDDTFLEKGISCIVVSLLN